jgi:hypothetical protein
MSLHMVINYYWRVKELYYGAGQKDMREHYFIKDGYMRTKKYRVITLDVNSILPTLGPYFCPSEKCNILAATSVEILYHMTEHKTPVMSPQSLAIIAQNIQYEIADFAHPFAG